MFTTDANLYRASLAAAVASGHPCLRVLAADESTLVRVTEVLEGYLGPLHHADTIEPGDPEDPDWELRVVLPGLEGRAALQVREALASHAHSWEVARSDAATAALDAGLLHVDALHGRGLVATCGSVAGGGLVIPDLWRSDTLDAPLQSLERALAVALAEAHPRLLLSGPRGPDTIQAVVHRPSGRPGIELWFAPEVFEGLDGDAVLALRASAVGAFAEVLTHDDVVLDPHLQWWPQLGGMALLALLAVPPGAHLATAPPFAGPAEPGPAALAALLAEEGFCHELEIQVIEPDPERALQIVLSAGGENWVGGPPRWLHGDPARLATCWRLPFDGLSPLDQITAPFRIVPGTPVGLDEEDRFHDHHVHWGTARVAVRSRHALHDQDREPTTLPRDLHAGDAALLPHVMTALGEHAGFLGPEGVLPVVGSDSRHGLRLDLERGAIPNAHPILEALTALHHPSLAAWIDVAFPRQRGLRLHLWARMSTDGFRTYMPVGNP